MPRPLLRIVLAALIGPACLLPAALGQFPAAAPVDNSRGSPAAEFVVEQPLHFVIPNIGDTPDAFSFRVFSKGGPITEFTVEKEITDTHGNVKPDGAAALTVQDPASPLTDAGKRVTFAPVASNFAPGDYTAHLVLRGRSGEGAKLIQLATPTITLTRTAADIDLAAVSDVFYHLVRHCGVASGSLPLQLREASGKSGADGIHLSALPLKYVVIHNTAEETHNAEACYPECHGLTHRAYATSIPAAGTLDVLLDVSGIKEAGVYRTVLRVDSPSLATPKTAQIKIAVKDDWPLPFVAVVVGVVLSLVINYCARTRRPRQLQAYQIAVLEVDWQKLNDVLGSAANLGASRNVRQLLEQATTANANGDITVSKTLLDTARTQFLALQALQNTNEDQLRADLEMAETRVQDYIHWLDKNRYPATVQALADALVAMKKRSVQLANGLVDATRKDLDDLLKTVAADFGPVLRTTLSDARTREQAVEQQLGGPTSIPPYFSDAVQDVDQGLAAAEKAMNEDKTGAAFDALVPAMSKLGFLESAVANPPPDVSAGRFAFPAGPMTTRHARPTVPLSVKIRGDSAGITTQTQVFFTLQGDLPGAGSVQWNFGDGRSAETADRTVWHRFSEARTYQVTASFPDPQRFPPVSCRVPVEPDPAENSIAKMHRRILRDQVLLSGFALAVAAWVGLTVSYSGNDVFGSPTDYLKAFLWGLGVDQTVHGFPPIANLFSGTTGNSAS